MILIIYSCNINNGEKYVSATIKYKHGNGDYDSVCIKNKKDLRLIETSLSELKADIAIFSISYTLNLFDEYGNSKQFEGNGFVLRDSLSSYYLPKGKLRDEYIKLLMQDAPKIEIDKVEEGN